MRLSLVALALLAACATREASGIRSTVFFQEQSSALDGAANATITGAADWARRHPGKAVTVTGFAGPAGDKSANEQLSRDRARDVSAALEKAGVSPIRLTYQGVGSVPYALDPVESRRVEITVGEPPAP